MGSIEYLLEAFIVYIFFANILKGFDLTMENEPIILKIFHSTFRIFF
jgi:hypothetical protein